MMLCARAARRLVAICAAFCATFCVVTAAAAQPPHLLADLGRGDDAPIDAALLGSVQGRAIFTASGELWSTDGTPLGTRPLLVDCGGPCNVQFRKAFGGEQRMLISESRDSVSTLWLTDGTAAGTQTLATDDGLELLPSTSDGSSTVELDGNLYLAGCHPAFQACGIWVVPRGSSTAHLLFSHEALQPPLLRSFEHELVAAFSDSVVVIHGTGGAETVLGFVASIRDLVVVHRQIFVLLDNGARTQVWRSDGTAAGSAVVLDHPGGGGFGQRLYTSATRAWIWSDDGVHGNELWSTAGSAASTRSETAFAADPTLAGLPTFLGDVPVFEAALDANHPRQLWTATGGRQIPLTGDCPDCRLTSDPLTAGAHVVFLFDDGAHGAELWSTDGTKAGTRLVRDACPGPCGVPATSPLLVLRGSNAYYWTLLGHELALWRSNGTVTGTRRLATLADSSLFVQSPLVWLAGGKAVFAFREATRGTAVWLATGSAQRLTPYFAVRAGSSPSGWLALADRALFIASDPASFGDHAYVATPGVVPPLARLTDLDDVCGFRGCSTLGVAGSRAYVLVEPSPSSFSAVWSTTGEVGSAVAIVSDAPWGLPGFAGHIGSTFVFARADDDHFEIWRSQGTPATTQKIGDLPIGFRPGPAASLPGGVYFAAGGEAFATDGAALRQITHFADTGNQVAPGSPFAQVGADVFFLGLGGGIGQLWRTDGSAAGPVLLAAPNFASDLIAQGDHVLLQAQVSPTVRGLWRAGHAAGLELLASFPGATGIEDGTRTVLSNGVAFFAARTSQQGAELWRSDGTPAGTTLVRDIAPGAASSTPTELVATPEGVVFAADDRRHGRELWRSDGTESGTRLVADLDPGGSTSFPLGLTLVQGNLYFSADDGLVGREPWVIDLDESTACVPDFETLCLNQGRFRAQARWRTSTHEGNGGGVALTGDTGYFWFFDSTNAEVVLKELDGRGVNGFFWTFYGALSNVEYWITVTDTETANARRYYNPPGYLASLADTAAFGTAAATASVPRPTLTPESLSALPTGTARSVVESCVAISTQLCLHGGRFGFKIDWNDGHGHTGHGIGENLAGGDTGYFWFFDVSNVEVIVKVLDGRSVNGRFWVFYGALSNVEYTLTVTDSATGATKIDHNPAGRLASVADTAAF